MKAEKKTVKHYWFDDQAKEQLFEVDYIVVPLLPEDQIKDFKNYLDNIDLERPLVVEEGYYQWDCAYYKDYETWYDSIRIRYYLKK